MNNDLLRKKYEVLFLRFKNKKEYFAQVLEKLRQKGKSEIYQKCLAKYQLLETIIAQIDTKNEMIDPTVLQKNYIKNRIKEFKITLKELNELCKNPIRQWIEAFGFAFLLAFVLRSVIFGLYHVPTGSAEPNILVGDRIWGNKMAYYVSNVQRGDLVIFDDPLFVYDRSSKIKYLWQKHVGLPIPILGLSEGPTNWVKRVIALPGDIIEGKVENGKTVIYINNEKIDEPYLNSYPLIAVKKSKGLIPWEHIGFFKTPMFLKYETKICNYTYDPSADYEKQPFYSFSKNQIVKNSKTGSPYFRNPGTPTFHHYPTVCVDEFGPYVIPPHKYWVMGDSRKNSVDSRWWLFLDEKLIHGRASFIIYSIDSEEAFWIFDFIKNPFYFFKTSVRWNRFFNTLRPHQGRK